MDKIIVTLYEEESDCDDCGYTSAFCVHVKSFVDKVPETNIGSSDCCSILNASLQDALKYIFKHLDLNMPYSNITLKAFEKIGDRDPNELYNNAEISYKHLIRYLNPRWKIAPGSSLESTAKEFLAKHNIELVVKHEY